MTNSDRLEYLMKHVKMSYSQAFWLAFNTETVKQLIKTYETEGVQACQNSLNKIVGR